MVSSNCSEVYMNVADFPELITCKVNCKSKKYIRYTNYIFKVPLYGSTFTIKFK